MMGSFFITINIYDQEWNFKVVVNFHIGDCLNMSFPRRRTVVRFTSNDGLKLSFRTEWNEVKNLPLPAGSALSFAERWILRFGFASLWMTHFFLHIYVSITKFLLFCSTHKPSGLFLSKLTGQQWTWSGIQAWRCQDNILIKSFLRRQESRIHHYRVLPTSVIQKEQSDWRIHLHILQDEAFYSHPSEGWCQRRLASRKLMSG